MFLFKFAGRFRAAFYIVNHLKCLYLPAAPFARRKAGSLAGVSRDKRAPALNGVTTRNVGFIALDAPPETNPYRLLGYPDLFGDFGVVAPT